MIGKSKTPVRVVEKRVREGLAGVGPKTRVVR